MADQEGNEVGAHAQGGGRGERYHAVDGHELGGAGGGDEWSGRDVGGSQAGNNFCGHEHGGAGLTPANIPSGRSEEHTSELQSRRDLVCRLLLEKKKDTTGTRIC